MTTELYWLTLTALMTALFWMPYVLNRMVVERLGRHALQARATGKQRAFVMGATRHQGSLPTPWRISRSSRPLC